MNRNQSPRRDLYAEITATIAARLESGALPWRGEWTRAAGASPFGPIPRRATGEQYRGINVLLLWMAAAEHGFTAPRWMTFKQALELGGAVRKGQRGSHIVFFKKLEVTGENRDTGEEETAMVPMMRGYTVFNVEQIDGLPADYYPAPFVPAAPLDRDHAAEAALRSSGATIRESGDQAFYAPGPDLVNLPEFARFSSVGGYLATMAHELCHWTGHKSRLDRNMKGRFGSNDYAFEELVAEIGAAFVGGQLGIVGDHIDNHAAYLAHWLEVLAADKRAIFKAASLAQAAADHVLRHAGAMPAAPAAAAPLAAPAPQMALL
jgi:antirestriction protein ArdC